MLAVGALLAVAIGLVLPTPNNADATHYLRPGVYTQ
jgi:hypothetical protein